MKPLIIRRRTGLNQFQRITYGLRPRSVIRTLREVRRLIRKPYIHCSIAMISIPYTYIAISFCLLVGFFKIGDLDEEIGWGLGLGTGVLALVLNHFFIGGYFGLALYAIGGFILLTAYKIIKSMPGKTGKDDDIEHGDPADP